MTQLIEKTKTEIFEKLRPFEIDILIDMLKKDLIEKKSDSLYKTILTYFNENAIFNAYYEILKDFTHEIDSLSTNGIDVSLAMSLYVQNRLGLKIYCSEGYKITSGMRELKIGGTIYYYSKHVHFTGYTGNAYCNDNVQLLFTSEDFKIKKTSNGSVEYNQQHYLKSWL